MFIFAQALGFLVLAAVIVAGVFHFISMISKD